MGELAGQKLSMFSFRNLPRSFWLEVLTVFVTLFLLSATFPPDINESHYLTKAKHFWNPSWCQSDLFLESADAHYVFFVTCGWPTLFLSLDLFAWCGRVLCWMAMALSWVYLNRVLEIRQWFSVVSAAMFVIMTNRFDMAGEWVVGGFEGKSITYALVVLAVGLFLERRWQGFWPAMGLACAFHAVVGVWALLCFAATSASQVLLATIGMGAKIKWQRPQVSTGVWISVGLFVLGLAAGCVPPILSNWGTSPDLISATNQIQVHERLSHHQLFENFPASKVGRFMLLILFWLLITRWFPLRPRERRVEWFCNTSLMISLAGVVLSGLAETAGPSADWANSLLRYYWFRFSDFAIPLGVALFCTRFASSMIARGSLAKRRTVVFSVCCLGLAGLLIAWESVSIGRSTADQRSLPTYPGDDERTLNTYHNWRKVCRWIFENSDRDSVFITPVEQQTFKWHAQRAEVACWKDMPQDAEGVVEWRRRVSELRGIETFDPVGYFGLSNEQLKYLVDQYQVTHFLMPQSMEDAGLAKSSKLDQLKKVYPENDDERSTYVVYQVRSSVDQEDLN